MRAEQRRVWTLPWLDERNAIACATQVVLALCKGYTKESAEETRAAARVINTWIQKQPADHDKAMLDVLAVVRNKASRFEMSAILNAALSITRRALLNDLTSNASDIRHVMEVVMYADGVAEHANDAMAKWRFYDATGWKKMDDELRAAFEAHWLAGEYAAGYAFVGAAWPKEWTSELLREDERKVGAGAAAMQITLQGLIHRTVQ